MKKWIKWTLLVLVLLIVSIGLYVRFGMGMEFPEGKPGKQADILAMRMMDAVGSTSWEQTRFVEWTFVGQNSYLWDRSESKVIFRNGDLEVMLNTRDRSGWAKASDEVLTGQDLEDALAKAWSSFCNDSFWLIAPLKAMDPGTERKLVESEEGNALLVTYSSGGVTPGDSYLWYLGEDYLPYAYRMWVQSPPMSGVKVTWEDWTDLHTGVKVAQKHMMGPVNVAISDLRSASSLEDLGHTEDPFSL